MNFTKPEIAVIQTLIYSDLFSFPLTKAEIHSRLIYHRTSQKHLELTLKSLLKKKIIFKSNDFYYLSRREKVVANRLNNIRSSQLKVKRAKTLATFLSFHPHIIGIFITGSLAVNNSPANDDIDFLIITNNHRLWSTRLVITPILDLLRLRRRPNSQYISNKLCLNLFLSPQNFSVPPSHRNLYTAYELAQTQPLIDKGGVLNLLYKKNPWIYSYLPNFPKPKQPLYRSHTQSSLFNAFAFKFQSRRMKDKITNERVSLHSAFFHPRNLSTDIMKKLSKQFSKYNIPDSL